MKVLKTDSPNEKALQEVEDLLLKYNMSISYAGLGILITVNKKDYHIIDLDSFENSQELPRTFDTERIVLSE